MAGPFIECGSVNGELIRCEPWRMIQAQMEFKDKCFAYVFELWLYVVLANWEAATTSQWWFFFMVLPTERLKQQMHTVTVLFCFNQLGYQEVETS